MASRVIILVGTMKGAFLFQSDERRREWKMTGPHLAGWEVYSLLGDSRHGNRIFAGTSSFVYGTTIRVSDDVGETWRQVEGSPQYSEASGFKLNHIWQIAPGHHSEPHTFYAGVDEAGLFVSRDRGETWTEVSALTRHSTRPGWFPGNGGLCLHTILVDPDNPKRIWAAISAVGAFRTDNGGESWTLCNNGLPPVETGEDYPEIGRCVHKIVLDPDRPETLYMQYHGGVFKSIDRADRWLPIEKGLPSNFGFPIGVSRSGDLFVVPQADDESRFLPGCKLVVYRSHDHGGTWQPAGEGLPVTPEYGGVLRDALAVDRLEPAGVYFGTSMGDLFYSRDDGDHWERLPGRFPRITTVKSWILDD